ncbi:AAA-domain-containing protein [Neocallimastix californiae]|uniref:AAA-domain-containing protein n=1 Tax=Neocallimastix californiae TaxID=1754190 RepID=A0A1Y2CZ58_9FUNG|nr:AAA-domain-containing protein [Neocallimastix californiae]|eukprot:ORY52237.1 AAA-domain-containing protein [Neocallimastix californiae]
MTPYTRINILRIDTTDVKESNEENKSISQLTSEINQMNINNNVKVSPLAGLENAYQSLLDIIMYPLIYPNYIKKLNVECPKGILLYGPPGVGKTTLVKTLSYNCNANLLTINGPEVYGPYIGDSEEKLRQIFEDAHILISQSKRPCILFIDEIDALAPLRENTQNHESRVVAQLLTLMDGMKQRGRLIIIGATNRPNAIDPALRRPGRFDREVVIDVPNEEARYRIIKEQTKEMPIDDSVDFKQLAETTNGFVGSDLCNLCREAAFCAFNNMITNSSNNKITMADFKKALAYVEPSLKREQSLKIENLTWDDVGGLEDVKKKIRQAVEWPLLYKDVYKRLGLNPAKGILLYGPPGCSKTTLVKIIANTSHASFFMISCASLYSSFVGDSEKLVRNVFQKARASSPAVVFIDEVDAIVGRRGIGSNGTSDSVQERILSMLLNELDGIEAISSVLIVGATNRPDLIDAALLRSGRFDQIIYVPPPDYEGRLKILDIYTKNMPISKNVDLNIIAKKTELYTGADIQNLCREAAIIALRKLQDIEFVEMNDFMSSLQVVKPSLSLEMINQYKSLVEKYGSGTMS